MLKLLRSLVQDSKRNRQNALMENEKLPLPLLHVKFGAKNSSLDRAYKELIESFKNTNQINAYDTYNWIYEDLGSFCVKNAIQQQSPIVRAKFLKVFFNFTRCYGYSYEGINLSSRSERLIKTVSDLLSKDVKFFLQFCITYPDLLNDYFCFLKIAKSFLDLYDKVIDYVLLNCENLFSSEKPDYNDTLLNVIKHLMEAFQDINKFANNKVPYVWILNSLQCYSTISSIFRDNQKLTLTGSNIIKKISQHLLGCDTRANLITPSLYNLTQYLNEAVTSNATMIEKIKKQIQEFFPNLKSRKSMPKSNYPDKRYANDLLCCYLSMLLKYEQFELADFILDNLKNVDDGYAQFMDVLRMATLNGFDNIFNFMFIDHDNAQLHINIFLEMHSLEYPDISALMSFFITSLQSKYTLSIAKVIHDAVDACKKANLIDTDASFEFSIDAHFLAVQNASKANNLDSLKLLDDLGLDLFVKNDDSYAFISENATIHIDILKFLISKSIPTAVVDDFIEHAVRQNLKVQRENYSGKLDSTYTVFALWECKDKYQNSKSLRDDNVFGFKINQIQYLYVLAIEYGNLEFIRDMVFTFNCDADSNPAILAVYTAIHNAKDGNILSHLKGRGYNINPCFTLNGQLYSGLHYAKEINNFVSMNYVFQNAKKFVLFNEHEEMSQANKESPGLWFLPPVNNQTKHLGEDLKQVRQSSAVKEASLPVRTRREPLPPIGRHRRLL